MRHTEEGTENKSIQLTQRKRRAADLCRWAESLMITIGTEDNDTLEQLLDEIGDFSSPTAKCFLCGKSLLAGNYTREHVVPTWAQRRYNLWDQHVVLLNGTRLPYRNLTVPCCDDCNKYRLKPIEDSLCMTVDHGGQSVEQLGKMVLFLWLGKILYGLLYKELTLLLDRSDPSQGTIVTPEILDRYKMHRFFLQQVRQTIECVDFCPASVHVFTMQKLPMPALSGTSATM